LGLQYTDIVYNTVSYFVFILDGVTQIAVSYLLNCVTCADVRMCNEAQGSG